MLNFSDNLSRSELADSLGVSRTTLWRLERAGRIPAGVRVNGSRTVFTPTDQMAIADLLRHPVEA